MMLESLTPRDFELWCKVVLERHFRCPVEEGPGVGDEGRDLLVRSPSGLIVVECKHQTRTAVGRPVIQKLHSAILTAGARSGMVLTTGRFSPAAVEYAEKLDVEIVLFDGTRLAQLAQTLGVSVTGAGSGDRAAWAVPTTPDDSFPATFLARVLSPDRFREGANRQAASAQRSTQYEGYFMADYDAEGSISAAGERKTASWAGRAWIRADGGETGLGPPPLMDPDQEQVPLEVVLEAVPGDAPPPDVGPHDAVRFLKESLQDHLSRTYRYVGGNNRSYSKEIRPATRSTRVSNARLVYVPRQSFTLRRGETVHVGTVAERGGSWHVSCASLESCAACKRPTDARTQVLCAVCTRPAHRRSFLHPDSFTCAACGAWVCAGHARVASKQVRCMACAEGSSKAPFRFTAHLVVGVVGTLVGIAWTVSNPQAWVLELGLPMAAGWWPLAYAGTSMMGKRKETRLRY